MGERDNRAAVAGGATMFGRRARQGQREVQHATALGGRHRFGVTAIAFVFAVGAVALGFVPASSVAASTTAASAATSAAPVVGSDAHHDTSRPLHSYQATNTKAVSHPAKHGPAGPQGPPAADTSGGSSPSANAPAATNNFDGIPDNSGVIPSDDTGAAGATQYFQIVNSQIAVYNKSGGLLLGPENTNTLWSGFGGSCQTNNDGDGSVQWDTLSQRWVVEQLEVSTQPFLICMAVSTSADATGTWNRYSFQYTNFPDYPKLGVWPDAYYLTVNQFNAAGTQGLGEMTCALNRASMLSGAAAAKVCFQLNTSGENTALPATLNGTAPPAAGAPEWLVGISPTTSNALAYWQFHVDWNNTANSTLSTQTDLPVTAFSEACGGAGTCIPQSGTSQQLDSLGDRLMYDMPYRNFAGHESIMVTHSIVAGSSVGMRWYELRPSGSTLGVFQSGSYAPNSTYRWMGSIGMDQSGDVALGYSTSSSTLHPGIAYTGRVASDAAGTMPQGETTLITGAGSQSGNILNPGNRWGDYTGMSVDPSDDCTFWYTNQYEPANGDFNWHTRIGSFKFPNCGTVTNDFSISANPTSLSLAANAAGSSTISTAVTSGSAGTVSLAVSGTPSGASASLAASSVTAGQSTTLNVNAGTATPGTYTLTVTGTEGSATHSTTVSLTVTNTPPPPGLVQLSSDSFSDPTAEHATQVEPDTLSNGSTIVSVFQVGRFNNGGSDGIGFATSTNGGAAWTSGLLPGLTTVQGGSPNLGWARVSDAAVAYDAKAGIWIAESLTINSSVTALGVAVNTSTDGVTWNPATQAISSTGDNFDKSWIVCDSTPSSSHYGNCYIEFDDNTQSNLLRMSTSTDGGHTWSAPRGTNDNAHGLGGQPLVQPNGNVVVPYFYDAGSQMRSFISTNGGSSWNGSRSISSVTDHAAAGGLRTEPLPSAEIDSAGRVYVVWQDCRFRSGCSSNDIVMSKSTNGTNWSSPTRVPVDATTSGVDHFIPGVAVDRSTSGSSAHLGLYYYYYPVANCGSSCSLDVGFISSSNGGTSWGSTTQAAGPMTLSEIAPTTQGPMVGDYMSASFLAGNAWGVFAVGVPGSGSTLNEAMYTLSGGLAAPGGTHQPDSGGGQGTTRGHSSTAF